MNSARFLGTSGFRVLSVALGVFAGAHPTSASATGSQPKTGREQRFVVKQKHARPQREELRGQLDLVVDEVRRIDRAVERAAHGESPPASSFILLHYINTYIEVCNKIVSRHSRCLNREKLGLKRDLLFEHVGVKKAAGRPPKAPPHRLQNLARALATRQARIDREREQHEEEIHEGVQGLLRLGGAQLPVTPRLPPPPDPGPATDPPQVGQVRPLAIEDDARDIAAPPAKRARGTLTAIKMGRPVQQVVQPRTLDTRVKELKNLCGGDHGVVLVMARWVSLPSTAAAHFSLAQTHSLHTHAPRYLAKNPDRVQDLFELLHSKGLTEGLKGSLEHALPGEAYISDLRVSEREGVLVECNCS